MEDVRCVCTARWPRRCSVQADVPAPGPSVLMGAVLPPCRCPPVAPGPCTCLVKKRLPHQMAQTGSGGRCQGCHGGPRCLGSGSPPGRPCCLPHEAAGWRAAALPARRAGAASAAAWACPCLRAPCRMGRSHPHPAASSLPQPAGEQRGGGTLLGTRLQAPGKATVSQSMLQCCSALPQNPAPGLAHGLVPTCCCMWSARL